MIYIQLSILIISNTTNIPHPQDVQHKIAMFNDTPILALHLGEDEPPGMSPSNLNLDEPIHNQDNANDTIINRSTTIASTQDECHSEDDQDLPTVQPPNHKPVFTHAIIPVDNLKRIVNKNLGECKKCGNDTLNFKMKHTISYATIFSIDCEFCENKLCTLRVGLWKDNKKGV